MSVKEFASRFSSPIHADIHHALLNYGNHIHEFARIAVLGLARDLGDNVERATMHLETFERAFFHVRTFIFENDSKDDTKARLQAWCDKAVDGRRKLRSQDFGREKWGSVRSPVRGDHMAEYRNLNKAMLFEDKWKPDFVVVVDLDVPYIDVASVFHTLTFRHWDAMGSNGLNFVKGRWIQNDVWAWRRQGDYTPLNLAEVHPIVPAVGEMPIPLSSCFGGMAVYRFEAFRAGTYAGGDCEHVAFHKSLAEAGFGRIYMNPSQLTCYSE